MTDIVKVYYDSNGFFSKTVFILGEINYDHTIHDEPGLIGVILSPADYKNTPPQAAMNGLSFQSNLNAVVAAKLSVTNPTLQAKILANNANPDAATLAKFNALMAAAAVIVAPSI